MIFAREGKAASRLDRSGTGEAAFVFCELGRGKGRAKGEVRTTSHLSCFIGRETDEGVNIYKLGWHMY